ncbi:MAG: cell wall hydrolase [Bacillota bacterium]
MTVMSTMAAYGAVLTHKNDNNAVQSQIQTGSGNNAGGIVESKGNVSNNDIYLMARVIEGEAANESFEGKVAVGAVIMNRVESGKFPGNVPQVIYQPNAFEAVSNGQYMRPLSQDSIKAAELAAKGDDPTNGCLYYWNPVTAQSKWVWQRPIIMQIGRHVFAR